MRLYKNKRELLSEKNQIELRIKELTMGIIVINNSCEYYRIKYHNKMISDLRLLNQYKLELHNINIELILNK